METTTRTMTWAAPLSRVVMLATTMTPSAAPVPRASQTQA
jgi:hypothetical protein